MLYGTTGPIEMPKEEIAAAAEESAAKEPGSPDILTGGVAAQVSQEPAPRATPQTYQLWLGVLALVLVALVVALYFAAG